MAMLAACGKTTDNATGTGSGAAGGAAGPVGTVVYLSASNFVGKWNPYGNLVLPHMRAQRMVYDYLMWFDEKGNFVPGLATSFENVSPTVWEVKLRKDVKFHDGQAFTSKDVKASVELASNPKTVTGSLFPGQLTVEIVDDYTCKIITPTPFAALKTGVLCGNQSAAIICHEDAAKGEDWLNSRMNGTGPYKWVNYGGEAGGLKLTANGSYWRGTPKVKDVVIKFVPDPSTRMSALQAGQADIIESVGPDEAKLLERSPEFKVQHTLSTDAITLAFRTQKAPLDNAKVRQAIAYAIDVPTIVSKLMLGYAEANKAFTPSVTLGYKEDPNYPKYDPEKAKRLLADAGFPNGQGLRELTMLTNQGMYAKSKEASEFIVQNLAAVGIKVKLQLMEASAWIDAWFKQDEGDIVLHGWLVPTPDRQSWFTSLFKSPGLMNALKSKELDDAIALQTGKMDPKQRAETIQTQLEPLFVNLLPEFPMFTYELVTAHSAKLEGLQIPHWYEFDMLPVSKKA